MDECIFCKIINNEIPCNIVYETDIVQAFMDIAPINKGHVLVIPKKHYETLLDIPEGILSDFIVETKKVAAAVKKATNADGFNLMMNNYKDAGQIVPHAHIHIVPRFKDDGLKLWPGGKYEEGEIKEFSKKIKNLL